MLIGMNSVLSRRDFLKMSALSMGGIALNPFLPGSFPPAYRMVDFPKGEYLGRVLATAEIKSRPDPDSNTVGTLYEDNIAVWLREVTGIMDRPVQKWVETPEGYIWSPRLQPVRNQPNLPLENLPQTSHGNGIWAEVTIPYVDLILENKTGLSPWVKNTQYPRLYYSQVVWIDQIKKNGQGQVLYHVNELYGSYGDRFWAAAEAFRPITAKEIEPISSDIQDKKIVVDATLQRQWLSCYEGNKEVYFCRVSTGAKFNDEGMAVDKWSTPPGTHHTWRKLVSLHMAGGTASGGYDLPGIAWTVLFATGGVAIHSTFWHNNYGVPMSHGCVNVRPEDAKWIFRWTTPTVPYDPGDITVSMPGGTPVQVLEMK